MAELELKEKAVKVVCNSCFREIFGFRDVSGVIKFKCPKCGTMTVSKVMSRRHVQIDMYAPQGQVVIDSDT